MAESKAVERVLAPILAAIRTGKKLMAKENMPEHDLRPLEGAVERVRLTMRGRLAQEEVARTHRAHVARDAENLAREETIVDHLAAQLCDRFRAEGKAAPEGFRNGTRTAASPWVRKEAGLEFGRRIARRVVAQKAVGLAVEVDGLAHACAQIKPLRKLHDTVLSSHPAPGDGFPGFRVTGTAHLISSLQAETFARDPRPGAPKLLPPGAPKLVPLREFVEAAERDLLAEIAAAPKTEEVPA